MEQLETDIYIKTLFGANAFHVPAQLILQSAGEYNGKPVCSIFGVIAGDPRLQETKDRDYAHELLICDIVVRPQQRYTDDRHHGAGVSNMLNGRAMFPKDWRYRYENGLLVPNERFDP